VIKGEFMLYRFLENNHPKNIWRDFDSLNDAITRSFLEQGTQQTSHFPQLNVYTKENEAYVQAFLPGVKIEDIDLTAKENVLFIKGNRKEEKLAEGTEVHIREMFQGEFSRSLEFPFLIDAENIKADFKDGVIGILVPRREDDKPKKITIQSSQTNS